MTTVPALLSLGDFQPLIGEMFSLGRGGPVEIPVRLSEVRSLGFTRPAAAGGRESFALLFHAPARARVPQGTYRFAHAKLGAPEIFVVPLGPDTQGMRLEAIFNFA